MKIAVQRSCGTCSACCEFPAVEALQKPAGELCCHASDAGCTIYAARPEACRTYTCLWREGEFGAGHRPDDLGLVFDLPSRVEDHPDYAGVSVVCAREMWPGARYGEAASALLTRLASSMVVRLSAEGRKPQLLGPRRVVELLVARTSARRAEDAR